MMDHTKSKDNFSSDPGKVNTLDGESGLEQPGQKSRLRLEGRRFHFIGAGGIGMSGLAKLLMNNNAFVRGSDCTFTPVVGELIQAGADIKIGHNVENLPEDTDIVVASAAVKEDNPELREARRRGLKVYKYAQMLGKITEHYKSLVIAGTHGKSTTSGWLTHCLRQTGLDCSFVVGAAVSQLRNSSGTGESEYFIAEACEYDRSFLNLCPYIGCILNIEQDHLDYYNDIDDIVEAFAQFAGRIRENGTLVINSDDKNCGKVIDAMRSGFSKHHSEIRTFGLSERSDYRAADIALENGYYSFDIYKFGNRLGRMKLSLPGKHNILNALAVTAVADNTGIAPAEVIRAASKFTGVYRRLMFKEKLDGITVLDDYAHHPTEIKASLEAVRQRYNPERLWCIFQPHQYSRTRFLLDDFAESFKLADTTIVPDIYFVRDSQSSRREVNSQILAERIENKGSKACFIDSFDGIINFLKKNAAPGDVVVTMGAGDIWKVADEYIQWLGRNS
jgi:UDP-N-acetylmuramate--alanine ligase